MMDMGNMGSAPSGGVSGNMQMTGTMEMGSVHAGTSSVLGGLLSTVTQLLFVALIISLVIGFAVWLKNTYFKESFYKAKETIRRDPLLRTIVVLASTLIGVIVILYVLGILLNGGLSPYHSGLVSTWTVSGILTFFVKVLTILFIIALAAFLFNYAKQNLSGISVTPVLGNPGSGARRTEAAKTEVLQVSATESESKPDSQGGQN